MFKVKIDITETKILKPMYGRYPIVLATYPRPIIPLPIATFFFFESLLAIKILPQIKAILAVQPPVIFSVLGIFSRIR